MADPRYAVPLDELVSRARVPVADQVQIQPEAQQPPPDWSTGLGLCADGMSGDADGD